MNEEYFKMIREELLAQSKRASTPLLVSSSLFNLPYREVRENDIRKFIYLYGRFKHEVFATFYQLKIPVQMVQEMNIHLREGAQKNADLALVVDHVLNMYSGFLDKACMQFYATQHPPKIEKKSKWRVLFNPVIVFFEIITIFWS